MKTEGGIRRRENKKRGRRIIKKECRKNEEFKKERETGEKRNKRQHE